MPGFGAFPPTIVQPPGWYFEPIRVTLAVVARNARQQPFRSVYIKTKL